MCEKCKYLLETPVGEKRKIVIKSVGDYPWESKEQGYYAKVEMVLDRYPDKVNAFIHVEEKDPRQIGLFSNISFPMNNCPICGQNLKLEKENN